MPTIDYQAHNQEVRTVLKAYEERRPIRVPCVVAMNVRMTLLNHELNPDGITFQSYMSDPDVMLHEQIRFQKWARTEIVVDHEMGLPEAWPVYVDYQNVYEAAWLGSEVHFPDTNCPSTHEWLTEENKWEIIDRGIPDAFDDTATGGWMKRSWAYYDYWCRLRDEGYECDGRPIEPQPMGDGTDGPFTVAINLRGGDLCVDMLADPEYFHALMSFVTEAVIQRVRAIRDKRGLPAKAREFGFADDSIVLISNDHYREFVQPYHERLIAELAEGERPPIDMHLCGDAQRFFPLMTRELRVKKYDTGFPIDFSKLREELGPDVEIMGGPKVDVLRNGPVDAIVDETRRILQSGIMDGGRFILKEANNLSPCTPPEHIQAFYDAAKAFGQY